MIERRLVPPPVEEFETNSAEEPPDFSDPKELERHRSEQLEERAIKEALEKEIDRLELFKPSQPKEKK